MKRRPNKKKKGKVFLYLPFESSGVIKAIEKYGEGRFEVPKERGMEGFKERINQHGAHIELNSILIKNAEGFLEMSCDVNKEDKAMQSIEAVLGESLTKLIKKKEKRIYVKAITLE